MDLTAEVIDVRVLNPFDPEIILRSVKKTGRLLVVDGGWLNCGFAGEVIASICERLDPSSLICSPQRVALPDCPAPCSPELEKLYYPDESTILKKVNEMFDIGTKS